MSTPQQRSDASWSPPAPAGHTTCHADAGADEPAGWARVLVWPLLVLVRFYRRWISPALPATCRFYPTCSTYGLTALRRFGPVKGTWLTVRRLARCHPWNPGGVDHVPPKGDPLGGTATRAASTAHVIAKDD